MSDLAVVTRPCVGRFGLKGPGAAAWLAFYGIAVPAAPNSWAGARHADDPEIFVARLGAAEFFVEDWERGTTLRGIEPRSDSHPPGVYPVLRQDAAFLLSGHGALEVLAQVCNVDFACLSLATNPVIMTSMIGVSVVVVPQDAEFTRQYRIWCDPSFGRYLGASLSSVVKECGGNNTGAATG